MVSPARNSIVVPMMRTFCRLVAGEVHLDPMPFAVVEGVMLEGGKIEIGAQFAIDAGEQIEIEFRGDAFGIVIGAVENIGRPFQIDADNQHRAGAEYAAGTAQERRTPHAARNCRWSSRERNPTRGIAAIVGRQLGHGGEIRDHRTDRQDAENRGAAARHPAARNRRRYRPAHKLRRSPRRAAECAPCGSNRRRTRSARSPAETARRLPARCSCKRPSSLRVG